jgi:hypothetical protein
VWQLPVRQPGFVRDLDCCLDAQRSPLALAWPGLRLRALPVEDGAPDAAWPPPGCAAYYQGAACDARVAAGATDAPSLGRLAAQCRRARGAGQLEPVAEATVSPESTGDLFPAPPRVGLYRWLPAAR